MSDSTTPDSFSDLGLSSPVQQNLSKLGYETPTPIQAACIPLLLNGGDLIGQAQTGTGKTAAFALPFIDRIDTRSNAVQLLVLAPTRELAIQVSEAFRSYARPFDHFHVLPIYGGQAYHNQLRSLERGVQVVVGTPGRVMDHIERGTLKLNKLKALVLDEADEMLRMGFIEDVEWILGHTPEERQIALFSATMPEAIKKIAQKYLHDAEIVKIASERKAVSPIAQSFLTVAAKQKMDALTRILEIIEMDAAIIFVRTKNSTVEVAERLDARGYSVAALNGDIPQAQRERTIDQLKKGRLDIVVATDVAARGIDVARISHVINYDVPSDNETYVHRIGRTGRAGREGEAILFVTPRERRLLNGLERVTGQKISALEMPTVTEINAQRQRRFHERLKQAIEHENLDSCRDLVEDFVNDSGIDPVLIAAALARLLQGDTPLLLDEELPLPPAGGKRKGGRENDRGERGDRGPRERGDRGGRGDRGDRGDRGSRGRRHEQLGADDFDERPLRFESRPLREFPDVPMQRYRIEVGHADNAKPGNIVGAIANEADIDSCYIGSVDIYDDFSLIDLPGDMPRDVIQTLRRARVAGKPMDIARIDRDGNVLGGGERSGGDRAGGKPPRKGAGNPGKPRAARDDKGKRGPAGGKPGKGQGGFNADGNKPLKRKPKHQKRKGKPAPRPGAAGGKKTGRKPGSFND